MGIIDKAVEWAVEIAADDSHKYSQSVRWGPHYDCSSFVITAYTNAGVDVQGAGATYTGDMYKAFTAKGFTDVTNSCDLSTGAGMKKGDVLLNTEYHAALVQIDGGTTVEARGSGAGIVSDQPYRNYPWDFVLRYPEISSGTAQTIAPKKTVTPPQGLGNRCTEFLRIKAATVKQQRLEPLFRNTVRTDSAASIQGTTQRYLPMRRCCNEKTFYPPSFRFS